MGVRLHKLVLFPGLCAVHVEAEHISLVNIAVVQGNNVGIVPVLKPETKYLCLLEYTLYFLPVREFSVRAPHIRHLP